MNAEFRNTLLRYSQDISDIADEVRLCHSDLECRDHIHYAVDTNILFFGVSPHKRADLGHVFFDDRIDDARKLALSLRRFLFERLCSFDRPFLISHGHDAEAHWAFDNMLMRGVHEYMEMEEEFNDISRDFAIELSNSKDPVALVEDALPKVVDLLARDAGPGQDYRRFAEIVDSRKVQRLALAFSSAPFFEKLFKENQELYGKFAVPRTLNDQIQETKYRGEWSDLFKAQGVEKNPYAMRCDVASLARIQLINERLEGTGHKIVLITADKVLISATKCVHTKTGSNFRDQFIRHPMAFLAAQAVLAPEEGAANEELNVSNTITLLDDWIKLLSDMMPVLARIEEDEAKKKEDSKIFEALALKIKSGWREHVEKLEVAHAASSSKYRRMIEQISTSGDETEVLEAMQGVVRKKLAEVHSSWEEFFEHVLSTSYLVFDHSKLPVRARSVPAIYFGRFHRAFATIKRISGNPKKQVSLEDIRQLEGCDDGGYSYCLSFAALFASLGKWQSAELIADQALMRRAKGAPNLEDLSGREAHYVKAIAQRLQAKTPAQLYGARKSLQHSEACLDEEVNRKSRDWLRVRFRSEEAALDLTELFLQISNGKKVKKATLRDKVNEISERIIFSLKDTKRIPDDWIRQHVTESLLTNLFIGASLLKIRDVRDVENTALINKITPQYMDYLTSDPGFGGAWRSYLGRVYFLFARTTYFPATEEDKKNFRRSLKELENLYREFKSLKVMPFDDERFEQVFDLVRLGIGKKNEAQ